MPADREEKKTKSLRTGLPKAPQQNPRPAGAFAREHSVNLSASFEPTVLGPRLAPPPALSSSHDRVRLPPLTDVRCINTTRLLPAKYSESVLTRIADNDEDLQLIFALDNATNDRLLAESNQRLGITARELVFEVPHHRIINAAFTHPHPQGARFSTPNRGAWYAGLELATAKAEILFHRAIQFVEINWQQPQELAYDQYTADFYGCFHDLRPAAFTQTAAAVCAQPDSFTDRPSALAIVEPPGGPGSALEIQAAEAPATAADFANCLTPGSYVASQQLAIHLLEAGSLGILYPSIRRAGGSCIACFRPSLVTNVRKRDLYCLRWYPDRAATFFRSPRVLSSGNTPSVAGG